MIPGGEGGGFDDGGMRNAPKRPSPGQAAVAGLFIERAECGRGANASLANRIMLLFKAVCKEERVRLKLDAGYPFCAESSRIHDMMPMTVTSSPSGRGMRPGEVKSSSLSPSSA